MTSKPPMSPTRNAARAAGPLMALPIAAWELSVGRYMLTRGFRTPAGTAVEPTFELDAPAPVVAQV